MCHDIYAMACHNWACYPTSPPLVPQTSQSCLYPLAWMLSPDPEQCYLLPGYTCNSSWHLPPSPHVCSKQVTHFGSVHPRPLCKGETGSSHTIETEWLESSQTAGKWEPCLGKEKTQSKKLLLLRVFSSFPMLLPETACRHPWVREGSRHSIPEE